MEALRGTNFTGAQTTPKPTPGDSCSRKEEDVGDGPSPSSSRPPPGASWVPEREGDGDSIGRDDGNFGQQSHRDSSHDGDGGDDDTGLGADGVGGEGDSVRVEGRGEAGKAANGFFKFYPFLNDVGHNEMDGEAR